MAGPVPRPAGRATAARHEASAGRGVPAGLGQFARFVAMGLLSACVHYGVLVVLVEGYRAQAVPASLVGYVAGGVVSYWLNRRHTYRSARPHRQATWRFALVAAAGFGFTWAFMTLFNRILDVPYLPAQVLTTVIVLFWSFGANKLWTFRDPGRREPIAPVL